MTMAPPAHESPESPAVATSSPYGIDRVRHRRKRLLWGVVGVVVVLALLLGAGGWLWWTRPSTTRVSLPAGVEGGETVPLASSLPPRQARTGTLVLGGLRSERHQWIGSVRWTPTGGKPTVYELHLGESVHIDGLGTVTLLAVNPPPLLSDQKSGGWTIEVNINLNPDLHWCEPWNPC